MRLHTEFMCFHCVFVNFSELALSVACPRHRISNSASPGNQSEFTLSSRFVASSPALSPVGPASTLAQQRKKNVRVHTEFTLRVSVSCRVTKRPRQHISATFSGKQRGHALSSCSSTCFWVLFGELVLSVACPRHRNSNSASPGNPREFTLSSRFVASPPTLSPVGPASAFAQQRRENNASSH
jgi:hypothetical protein